MRSEHRARSRPVVGRRHGPDRNPVRLERSERVGLGDAECRGDANDHIVAVRVVPESRNPGRVGRIRIGHERAASEHSDDRERDEAASHAVA